MERAQKLSSGQKAIITVGAFVITFITICSFFKNDIKYIVKSKSIEKQYGDIQENSYFIEDNFDYVNDYTKTSVNSKSEIFDSIYYIVNSGLTHAKRYCGKNYKSCFDDMTSISNDEEALSLLNNYVHPYNSFDNITFNFDNDTIEITIKHTYSDKEIQTLNKIVNKVIKNNIKDNMTSRDKIKAIHDYIINNTDYDTLKTENPKDTTYKSNTAYGVLVEGYGICSGYSDAMAIFLDKLNFINYKISNDQHIWNLVYLDNQWLHLDLTWDDPVSDKNVTRDNYFLIITDTLRMLDDNVHYFNSDVFREANKRTTN